MGLIRKQEKLRKQLNTKENADLSNQITKRSILDINDGVYLLNKYYRVAENETKCGWEYDILCNKNNNIIDKYNFTYRITFTHGAYEKSLGRILNEIHCKIFKDLYIGSKSIYTKISKWKSRRYEMLHIYINGENLVDLNFTDRYSVIYGTNVYENRDYYIITIITKCNNAILMYQKSTGRFKIIPGTAILKISADENIIVDYMLNGSLTKLTISDANRLRLGT